MHRNAVWVAAGSEVYISTADQVLSIGFHSYCYNKQFMNGSVISSHTFLDM